jgi:CheY-like chemotaxis protein
MVLQAPLRGDIRALVVDDDPQVLRVIHRQLERLGISEVQTAADAEEAMHLVTSASRSYDVVLCDLCMPNEDGLALLRRLADCRDKPAVILTSGEGAPMLEAKRRLGDNRNLEILGVAAKPHSLATLAQLLARLSAPRSLPGVESPASAAPSPR